MKKKMFAAVNAIYDREDLEDSVVTIIGVYGTEESAKQALEEHRVDFLADLDEEDEAHAEEMLYDDNDRHYAWFVQSVEVEV